MISKLQSVIRCASIAFAVSMSTGCIPSSNNLQDSNEKMPPKDVIIGVTNTKLNDLNKLDETYEFLTFQSNYAITSEFGDFGEELTFLPDKVSGDLIVAKGSYSSGVLFYRIYNLSFDKKQILYEVTNESKETYEQFEKSKNVFSFKSKKSITLLERPYEVGHSWNDGSITAIYEVAGEYYIEVTYKNHNKIIFSNQKGVKEIHYTLPPELQEIYEGITEDVIVGK